MTRSRPTRRWRQASAIDGAIWLCSGRKRSEPLFFSGPASVFTERFSLTRRRTNSTPGGLSNSLSSIALMQGSYWVSYRVRPPLPQFQNALLGHAILFLARLGFVLPTSIFGFLFVAQRPEFEIPVYQYLIILLGLFSILLRAEAGAPGSRFHRLRKGPRCQRRLALHANRARRMSAICAFRPARFDVKRT